MSPHQKSEFEETNRIFCEEVIGGRTFDRLDRIYTRGARVMPPGMEMVTGVDQAKALWQNMVTAVGATACSLRSVELEVLGETAIEIGRAEIATGVGSMQAKYVVVWKREGGVWKWDIDIWNTVQ